MLLKGKQREKWGRANEGDLKQFIRQVNLIGQHLGVGKQDRPRDISVVRKVRMTKRGDSSGNLQKAGGNGGRVKPVGKRENRSGPSAVRKRNKNTDKEKIIRNSTRCSQLENFGRERGKCAR